MAILEVKNIEKHFGSTKVLKDISFDLEEGQTLAIIGSSGSGKTTLLRCLNFLETPNHGTISVKGEKLFDASLPRVKKDKALRDKRLHFGMVFQSFNLLPELTAYENIILPLMLQNKNIDDKYVDKLIERLELKDRMNHLPGQLSGGQQQRVALARALINRPSLLLCDEPTGNLDKKTTQSVMELLFDMSKEYSVTLLVVTHDENIAKRFSRVITISDGILGGDI